MCVGLLERGWCESGEERSDVRLGPSTLPARCALVAGLRGPPGSLGGPNLIGRGCGDEIDNFPRGTFVFEGDCGKAPNRSFFILAFLPIVEKNPELRGLSEVDGDIDPNV